MQDELKYKVISLLQKPDLTARMIAEELDLSYASVLRLEKQYNEAKLNNTVDQLINVDEAVLTTAADSLGLDAKALTKELSGLDKLSSELQVTALQINTRARSLVMSIEHVSELEAITGIICDLNKAFINDNKTQVNVQNNYGGEQNAASRYDQYLSDVPA